MLLPVDCMLVFVGAMIPFASVLVSVEISLVAEVDIETPSEIDFEGYRNSAVDAFVAICGFG
jgi:hypothetical protein